MVTGRHEVKPGNEVDNVENTRMAKSPSSNRRQFLLGAGMTSVAAAAVVATTSRPGAPPPPGAKVRARAGRGYELTEHIRNYYRTTAI